MAPPRASRYTNLALRLTDYLTTVLTTPFTTCLSAGCACYCLTTLDTQGFIVLFLRFAVCGPILVIASALLLLPAFLGWLIWVAMNTLFAHTIQPFQYYTHTNAHAHEGDCAHTGGRFTVASANVLLCPEPIARFNNCPNARWRSREIASRLLQQDSKLNQECNLKPPVQREKVVVAELPDIDVLLLQEVFGIFNTRRLISVLKHRYAHILHNAGVHTAKDNMYMCESGLVIASKHSVTDAHFHPYNHHAHYGCVVAMGVLMAKLDLGERERDGRKLKAVGYVANTHTQAYQGERNIVSLQLTEAAQEFKQYIKRTHDAHTEKLVYAVMGGDFNSDNISKGDSEVQTLPLWDEFEDPCREAAGIDAHWSVGTEHRQTHIHHLLLKHPSNFKTVLIDDVVRRRFILDAVVETHSLDLMRVEPKPDTDGFIRATPEGGRRRIDRVVLWRGGSSGSSSSSSSSGSSSVVVGYWFSSVLCGLTDHVPVVMMVEEV